MIVTAVDRRRKEALVVATKRVSETEAHLPRIFSVERIGAGFVGPRGWDAVENKNRRSGIEITPLAGVDPARGRTE